MVECLWLVWQDVSENRESFHHVLQLGELRESFFPVAVFFT